MNNKFRNEIEKHFALQGGYGAYEIHSHVPGCQFWVFNDGKEFGVFFEYEGEDIFEKFSGTELKSDVRRIENTGSIRVIMLTSRIYALRNEFSFICEDFVDPGEKGEKRKDILEQPATWWERWKILMGNSQHNKMVYDVIGELMAVLKLCELGKDPFWSAIELSSHDIESGGESFEVKSTLNKSLSQIHISSQFQLMSEKPLYLIFTRLEKSLEGQCVNDLIKKIKIYQPEKSILYNAYLCENGFEEGNHARKEKYKILERRKLLVDDTFPRITEKLFIDGKMPAEVTHLEYDVNIDGLKFENWR